MKKFLTLALSALEKLRQELQDGPAPQLVRRRPHSSGT